MKPTPRQPKLHRNSECQNMNPNSNQTVHPVQLTPATQQCIQKCLHTFTSQLETNRAYLQNLDSKLTAVYKKELFRGVLKEREYKNLLKDLHLHKQKMQDKVEAMRVEQQRDYQAIMECNRRLRELRNGYEIILAKEDLLIKEEQTAIQGLVTQNEEVKTVIKNYWRQICDKKKQIQDLIGFQVTEDPIIKEKRRRGKTDSHSYFKPIRNSSLFKPLTEQSSVYITTQAYTPKNSCLISPKSGYQVKKSTAMASTMEQSTAQQSAADQSPSLLSPQKILPTDESMSSIKKSPSVSNYSNIYPNKSLLQLQSSLLNIDNLQAEIRYLKSHRSSTIKLTTKSQEEIKKQKIKERIEEIEERNEMIKLFIVYIKKKQMKDNSNTAKYRPAPFDKEVANWYKIRCYFEKVLEHKETILQKVKEMNRDVNVNTNTSPNSNNNESTNTQNHHHPATIFSVL